MSDVSAEGMRTQMGMQVWRVRWLLAATVALAVLLGACSDDTSSAEPAPDAIVEVPIEDSAPPLPDEDRTGELEAGPVVVHGWDEDRTRQLWSLAGDGAEPAELPIDGFDGVLGAVVAPDGHTLAALGWTPGDHERSTNLLVGTLDSGLEPVFEDDDLSMWCVRWFPSGDRVLLTGFLEGEVNPLLLSVDLDGVATPIVVPSGRFECAIPLDDDRVVLSYIGEGTSLVGMATVDLAGGEAELLFAKPGCLIYGGALSPAGDEIVTAASCETPADSGVHVIDVATGEVDHLLVAEVAFPSWSPSGAWLAFGVFPASDTTPSTVHAMRRDGSGFRSLTDMGSTQPAWLAPLAG